MKVQKNTPSIKTIALSLTAFSENVRVYVFDDVYAVYGVYDICSVVVVVLAFVSADADGSVVVVDVLAVVVVVGCVDVVVGTSKSISEVYKEKP